MTPGDLIATSDGLATIQAAKTRPLSSILPLGELISAINEDNQLWLGRWLQNCWPIGHPNAPGTDAGPRR